MARRATRNAQQTIYRLYFWPLEHNERTHLILRPGGGGCQIVLGQIIYFRRGLGREIYFYVAWARKIYFRVHMVSPQSTALRQLLETVMLLKAVVYKLELLI